MVARLRVSKTTYILSCLGSSQNGIFLGQAMSMRSFQAPNIAMFGVDYLIHAITYTDIITTITTDNNKGIKSRIRDLENKINFNSAMSLIE